MYGCVTKALALLQPQQPGLSRLLLTLEGTVCPPPQRHGAHRAGVNSCEGPARFLWAVWFGAAFPALWGQPAVSQATDHFCAWCRAERNGAALGIVSAWELARQELGLCSWCGVLSSAAWHSMVLGWEWGSEPYTAGAMGPWGRCPGWPPSLSVLAGGPLAGGAAAAPSGQAI